ncbi:hypothetical protein [Bacillus swezeyi]|uniref:Uncharacterized protein n=1 Tax=Bacillus swezeyi TaxID=1925020 RepID=A0A5M8RJF1_9BACI|nr:hypothetical protein [Bacillus swezeyi]KAA6446974.1 hypothetical protein DX927_23300 [Bacillus swezeyi]KAA6471542.1 hypothetical protein DX928_23540 [Bacillus swezeyi]
MYFKCDYHEETAIKLMNQLGFKRIEDNREYGSFCYLASATYKYEGLKKVVDEEGIDLDTLEQQMLVYSPSEMAMIRFGLQLFNSNIDDITIPDLMMSLDDENCQVVLSAIKFRFNIKQ